MTSKCLLGSASGSQLRRTHRSIFEYLSDCAAAFGTRKQMLITSTKCQ